MSAEFIIGLHVAFVLCAILIAWWRARSFLHPYFVMTVFVCVFLSDFIIRGYQDKNWRGIPLESIMSHQLTILGIFSAILILAFFHHKPRTEYVVRQRTLNLSVTRTTQMLILLVILFIVGADVFKRLISVGGSISTVIEQSLGPRGLRDWDQAAYSGNFIFSILTILLPLSGIGAAYLAVVGRGMVRFLALLVLGLSLCLLVTNGSRTPVVMVVGTFWFLLFLRIRSRTLKVFITGIMIVGVAMLTSLMLQNRALGFNANSTSLRQDTSQSFVYHQDDSYYRAIKAMEVSDRTTVRWDQTYFTLAIVTNPVPRSFWPGKPLLDQQFYGPYKLHYVTNLFIGEFAALGGFWGTLIGSILFGYILYRLLYSASRMISFPLGLPAYMIFSLYIYMCMRSMVNLTHFIYLPAFTILLVWIVARWQHRSRYDSYTAQPSHVYR